MGTLGDNDRQRAGIGMTSVRTRTRMVERLREQGITDEPVLAAMTEIPRHVFVDEALAIRAYDDVPLPIGHGQTISQPWVVARMTELARKDERVERIGALVAKARRNLQSLKLKNVSLKHGDGSHELGEALAVDAILITAAATHVPTPLLRYLNPGGRMVLPLAQPGEARGTQRLTVLELAATGLKETTLDAVRFVPLLSGLA